MDDVIAGFKILQVRNKRRNLLPAAMLLREMLGLVENICFGINLEARLRQAQAGRNLSDADDRHCRLLNGLQWLLAKFTTERQAIFMKDVAQTFSHPDSAAKKDNFAARIMRLPDRFSHVFDPAVKLIARLSFHGKRWTCHPELFEIH